jgi:hypothetical protein
MSVIEQFIEFVQREKKIRLNTKQEIVVRIILQDPRMLDLLYTPGSGKTTLFRLLEDFAHTLPLYPPQAPKKVEKPLVK